MSGSFPRPGAAKMAARKAAFDGRGRPEPFKRRAFAAQNIQMAGDERSAPRHVRLVARSLNCLATHPDGVGNGYCRQPVATPDEADYHDRDWAKSNINLPIDTLILFDD
jgi:hypothetical protein